MFLFSPIRATCPEHLTIPDSIIIVLKHPCSSLNFRDQVSHPYRPTGKTTVVYIIVVMFFDSRREGYRFWIEW
jgi:hypothetical protein